ncbi:hypothetical protein [Synoicihabitans lomoniglobus]|uniref:Uncharacterized protein n=1 Tax=Synoicihabitans lomoniglobus TaxID=2909285 RepID=A0AAF0CRY9_9BACT|nr:hypothetical protein [Opitutaceae bacterium LMO-M01]WED66995.1 hypothetical protein PXH66_09045 [Opitutaceae bacterium LMO-M01]
MPPVLLETKASAAYDIPVAVDLDADGHLLAIHEGNMIVPEQVRAVVEQMTFLPAVENGQAIATTLTFNPAGFFKAGSR